MGKGYKPDVDTLNEQLAKKHLPKEVRLTSLAEVEVPKAEAVLELTIAGLG